MRRALVFLACFLVFCLSFSLRAQDPNATVSGRVLDASGGVVPLTQVMVINDATNIGYSTVTNELGIYSVQSIPPGKYHIQLSKNGFKNMVKPDVTLHVQDALTINFTLEIGAGSESVTVEGGAPLINVENATVSTVIDRNFTENLPLNGRSFNTLLQLTPGVVIVPPPSGGNNLTTPGQFSIAGQRADSNNFSVDGVSANFGVGAGTGQAQNGTGNAQAFSAIGGTSSLVSVDALQEFRIETSSYAPEFGRSPGGQITLSTRSGTNDFHGGVFDYFRNTVMDANDWFANQRGNPRAPEQHNDFGGFLGGPVWKDRTFIFASYEGARLNLPQTTVIPVPSAYARSIAPPAVAPYVKAYPIPDDNTIVSGVYISNFTGTYANRANLDAGSIRIDHKLSDRFSLFGRYNDAPSQIVSRTDNLSEVTTASVNTRTLTVGVDMSLTSRIVNTLRGNYSTQMAGFAFSMDSFGGATPFDASLILGTLPVTQNEAAYFPGDIGGFSIGLGAHNETKQMNFVDGLSLAFGKHQLKFGADYRAIFLNARPAKYGVDLLTLDTPTFVSPGTAGQLFFLITGNTNPARMLTQTLSLYGQDTWKVSGHLTVTYGLRWEWAPAPSALGSTSLASWINTNDATKVVLGPAGAPLWKTTYSNFAPRFGLAYRLDGRGSLVLRIGGGIFYDLSVGSSAQLGSQFPNSNVNQIPGALLGGSASVPIGDPTPFLPGPASLIPPYPDGVFANSQNLKLPRSYQWNASIEKSFGNRQAISATYVGQAGRDLLRQEALNQPNANFAGNLFLTRNDAYSNYQALQVQYRRPISGRLQALLNYTWSHSLDNASNDFLIGLSNVISALNDYASSDSDVRHSFSGAVTYAMPSAGKSGPLSLLTRDWTLSTVAVVRTGLPFNVLIPAPSSLGVMFRRPDLVTGQPSYVYGSQCAAVFQGLKVLAPGQSCPGGRGLNPSAFQTPSTARQGTEGRNDIPGFGLAQVDLSIGRKFPITERVNLQFRADAFNLVNHPNFTNPSATKTAVPINFLSTQMLNKGLGGLNSLFQEGGPRSLQISLKVVF